MKKYLIFILSINLLLTSCTQKSDNVEPIIKEKEQLESNLEIANKYINELEQKLKVRETDTEENKDTKEQREEMPEYKFEDFVGEWMLDDPNGAGIYIDELVVCDLYSLEVPSWGFVQDYRIYDNTLVIKKKMAKIEDGSGGELSSDSEVIEYDVFTIGDRNGKKYIARSFDNDKGGSFYNSDEEIPEYAAILVYKYEPKLYYEYYGDKYEFWKGDSIYESN